MNFKKEIPSANGTKELILQEGDITKVKVDAIVNAANSALIPGGGVDGAIHRAAGPEFTAEVAKLREKYGGVKTGEVLLAKGRRLPAKYVILTAGPIWHGGTHEEATLLANCYKNSILLAEKENLKSIAFPSISTGVYGYPMEQAAKVALSACIELLPDMKYVQKVLFILFGKQAYQTYEHILKQNFG